MIKEHCFSKEWITIFRKEKEYSKINPPILEKMINALSLLQYLVKYDLEFVFKGGTSLILLLEKLPDKSGFFYWHKTIEILEKKDD